MDFCAEAETLRAIAVHDGPIIVDFDQTLYLGNSTEDFLATTRPAALAALILRVLDLLAPWRVAGGDRDVWRVGIVSRLFPGVGTAWPTHCARLGPIFVNVGLRAALLNKTAQLAIASNGFLPIIAPLLAAMDCPDATLIACDLATASRCASKNARIELQLGAAFLATAIVITDSETDSELLAACAKPALTRWHGAKFTPAFAGKIYLPGDYLAQAKRPTQPHVRRQLLTDDLAFWLLLTLTGAGISFGRLAGATCLFVSFWSVYETGYQDNDFCAQNYEVDPVLAAPALSFDMPYFVFKAWATSLVFATFGLVFLHPVYPAAAAAKWLCLLLCLRVTYFIFNRLDKATRPWLYIALQGFRSLGLAVLIPLGPAGVAAGLAQIISRWQGYLTYRTVNRLGVLAWPTLPARAIQTALFIVILLVLASASPGLANWSTFLLLAWSGLLARREIYSLARAAHWLPASSSRKKSAKPTPRS